MLITFDKKDLINSSGDLGIELVDLMRTSPARLEVVDENRELFLDSSTEFKEFLCSIKNNKKLSGSILETIRGQKFRCDSCSMKRKGECQ